MTRQLDRADDLLADTVLLLLTGWTKFQPGTNFDAGAFTVCRNRYYSLHRNNRLVEDPDDALSRALPDFRNPLDTLTAKETLRDVLQLPPAYRDILVRLAEGLSYDEVASELGCSVGTIKSRVSRARSWLQGVDS